MSSFPLAVISPLRMGTDGQGVTTLVAAAGCPLCCRMCINPGTWDGSRVPVMVGPRELYEKVRSHSLYYIATGGGVTFGGGEPLLHSGFIREFALLCPAEWAIRAETSLYVPRANVEEAASCVAHFFVDIKDTDPDIYRAYTGGDVNVALGNLKRLAELAGPERVTVRLPRIPGFNTARDVDKSEKLLAGLGINRFDRFEYRDKRKDHPK